MPSDTDHRLSRLQDLSLTDLSFYSRIHRSSFSYQSGQTLTGPATSPFNADLAPLTGSGLADDGVFSEFDDRQQKRNGVLSRHFRT